LTWPTCSATIIGIAACEVAPELPPPEPPPAPPPPPDCRVTTPMPPPENLVFGIGKLDSVNHTFPSGPLVIPIGPACAVVSNVVTVGLGWDGWIMSTWSVPPAVFAVTVNQMLPSGPDVMPDSEKLASPGIDKEKTLAPALTAVAGLITPIFPSEESVNQIF